MTPDDLKRLKKLQEHVAKLDLNDKEVVRLERDIRRAISNTGRIPTDIYGVMAYFTPDDELYSRVIIANDASNAEGQAAFTTLDEKRQVEVIERILERTARGYGAALSALLREVEGKASLMHPLMRQEFLDHVLGQALGGMERTSEDAEFLKAVAEKIFGRRK